MSNQVNYLREQIKSQEKKLEKLKNKLEKSLLIEEKLKNNNLLYFGNLVVSTDLSIFEKACYEISYGYREKILKIYTNINIKDNNDIKIKVYYAELDSRNAPRIFSRNIIKYDYYTKNMIVNDLNIDHLTDKQCRKIRKKIIDYIARNMKDFKVDVKDEKTKKMLSFV
jgi:hypothetical protein